MSALGMLWHSAFVFGPAVSLLTVLAIGGLGAVLDSQALLNFAGIVALAFLIPAVIPHLASPFPRSRREPTKSSGNTTDRHVLHPEPAQPLPRRFVRAAMVQLDELGVILRTVDRKFIRFAAPGPNAISRYVIRTESGTPRCLDLMAGDHTLVRLPWDQWFPDTSTDRVNKALGVTAEFSPLKGDGATEPSFFHADHEYTVGPDVRFTVLSLLTCVIAFSTAQGLSPVLGNVVLVASLTAASLVILADLTWGLILRHRSRTP